MSQGNRWMRMSENKIWLMLTCFLSFFPVLSCWPFWDSYTFSLIHFHDFYSYLWFENNSSIFRNYFIEITQTAILTQCNSLELQFEILKLDTFTQQGGIKLIKIDSKDINNVFTKDIEDLFFNQILFIDQRILKKCITASTKVLSIVLLFSALIIIIINVSRAAY